MPDNVCKSLFVAALSFFLAACNPQTEIQEQTSISNGQVGGLALAVNQPVFQGSEYIRGVEDAQWDMIEKIGDPQNCRSRIAALDAISDGKLVTSNMFSKNPNAINSALRNHNVVYLSDGIYELERPIILNGDTLIGGNNTIIDAKNVSEAITVRNANLKNIRVKNAGRVGIEIKKNVTIKNVIVENTGVVNTENNRGHGFSILGATSDNNCLVSVEAYNGYNATGSGRSAEKGGNADGFEIKFGANGITLIDAHGHHNSDDGFDLWKSGDGTGVSPDKIIIRIFYSSANHNGKNPLTLNGDGNGFKMGSDDAYQRPKKDEGARLIYGSASCYNLTRGFDRNKTAMKILGGKLNSVGNGDSDYSGFAQYFAVGKDEFALKCHMFPRR